jgi:hypothetical protein
VARIDYGQVPSVRKPNTQNKNMGGG